MLAACALLLALQQAPAADPAALARDLRDLRRAERHAEALALLDQQPPALLADARVAGERIQLLLDDDRAEEARAVDAALGAVSSGPVPLFVARLRLQILDGRAEAALGHAEAALPQFESAFEVHGARLRALCALERWSEAAAALSALPANTPPPLRVRLKVDLLLEHGRVLAEDADLLERAVPLFEEALQLQPARMDVRTELVTALAQWHRADRAEQLVREVLDDARGARRADLLFALGRVHRTEQREEQALACFREALDLAPNHGRTALALARCLLDQGQDEEAVALVQRRLARAPEDPEAWFVLAERALDRREPQAAIDALQHVLDRFPQSLKAQYMLSRALAQTGDFARQADVLERYAARAAAIAKQ